MNRETENVEIIVSQQEQRIAALLWYGTWLASMIVAAGLTLDFLHQLGGQFLRDISGFSVMRGGIALFILLPIARVMLMLFIFLRERDYMYVTISALVIATITAGFFVGL